MVKISETMPYQFATEKLML